MNTCSKFIRNYLLITTLLSISCLCAAQIESGLISKENNPCFTDLKTASCISDIQPDAAFSSKNNDIENLSVSLDELDQERGLGGVFDVESIANLEAILTDNYISNSVTGNNTIDNGSFTDSSGVFSIIQNTGNNVIIQDSTIITVTITPN